MRIMERSSYRLREVCFVMRRMLPTRFHEQLCTCYLCYAEARLSEFGVGIMERSSYRLREVQVYMRRLLPTRFHKESCVCYLCYL